MTYATHRQLLTAYLRPEGPRVLLLAALLFGGLALQLVNPQIMRAFLDAATAGASQERLVGMAVLFIGLAVLDQLLSVGATYVGELVGWSATNRLRADLALHCLRLDLGFHKEHAPGSMIERLDGDVTALSNFFSQFIIRILGNALLLVGVLALLFREDWRVGAALTAYAAVALAVLHAMRGIAVPAWKEAREASAEFYGFLEERLSGTEDIRATGSGPYVMRRFFELVQARLQAERKAALTGSKLGATTLTLFTLGLGVAFTVGFNLYRAGVLSIGTVYLVFHYTQTLFRPLIQITQQMEDLQKAGAGIERIQELLGVTSRIQDGPGAPIPEGALSVEVDGVTFAYDAEETVLRDVSFRLEPGRVLGLLGRTGSGKSTLARLLFRLYDPQSGAVRLGGTPLSEAHLDQLRARVGMVTQDVQLFRGTLRDNLTFFNPDVPDARILAVLEELGLGDWCRSLPHGLDTELESGGAGLSAGEGQLLAFTRVFLRDPGLVILDEASSRLDPATEELIERAVDRLLRGRTGIVIAHRLGTVQRAQEILILEEGRVLERGDRRALAADPGSRFAALLRTGLEEALA